MENKTLSLRDIFNTRNNLETSKVHTTGDLGIRSILGEICSLGNELIRSRKGSTKDCDLVSLQLHNKFSSWGMYPMQALGYYSIEGPDVVDPFKTENFVLTFEPLAGNLARILLVNVKSFRENDGLYWGQLTIAKRSGSDINSISYRVCPTFNHNQTNLAIANFIEDERYLIARPGIPADFLNQDQISEFDRLLSK